MLISLELRMTKFDKKIANNTKSRIRHITDDRFYN